MARDSWGRGSSPAPTMHRILYHNPRCATSRAAKRILDDAGIDHDTVLYLKQPPDETTLLALLRKLDAPRALLRTKQARQAGWRDADNPDDIATLARFLARHPEAMERPVLVAGRRAVVGRPPERIKELIPTV